MTDKPEVRRCKARGGHPKPALQGSDFCRVHIGPAEAARLRALREPITEDHGPVESPAEVLDRLIAEAEAHLAHLKRVRDLTRAVESVGTVESTAPAEAGTTAPPPTWPGR